MPSIVSATVLAAVLPEGMKSVGVRIEFSEPVSAEGTYLVENREVLSVYAQDRTVELCLDTGKAAQMTCMLDDDGSEILPGGNGPRRMGYMAIRPQNMRVYTPYGDVTASQVSCPDIERFLTDEFEGLKYSYFVPKHYDPAKKYPLVLFIPDATGKGLDARIPLVQGIGGTVWAKPEIQQKHPCFVVCPCYAPGVQLTYDDFSFDPALYKSVRLIEDLSRRYSIDQSRIYGTGQSAGCMCNCQIDIDFPNLMAAQILVAGQWDPQKCGRVMCNRPLWILVSEGDIKAHPGMNAITAAIEENGGRVGRYVWDAKAKEKWPEYVEKALQDDVVCRYTVFEGNSVIPDGEDPNPGAHHMCTWRAAYQIEGVQDWLFDQHK